MQQKKLSLNTLSGLTTTTTSKSPLLIVIFIVGSLLFFFLNKVEASTNNINNNALKIRDSTKPTTKISFHTALDEFMKYYNSNNTYYSYRLINTINGMEATTYVLNMTSQVWLTSKEILNGRFIWWHFLLVIVPHNLNREKKEGLMWMIGKKNTDKTPNLDDLKDLTKIAITTGTVVTEMLQVPNQPIVFEVDPTKAERSEDSLVALTWRHFLNDTSKPYWIAHLPMTRAGQKGLDTIQDFIKKQFGHSIESFTVQGTSKKGWTTWLLAAVDKRVKSIYPMVIAVLNLKKNLIETYDSLCNFPEAMGSYVEQGVVTRFNTKEFEQLAEILDPLIYNERYTNINKLLIYSLGDEFFWPDLSINGYPQLLGEKRLKYLPNTGHNMDGSDMMDAVLVDYYCHLYGITLPTYDFNSKDLLDGIQLELRIYTTSNYYNSNNKNVNNNNQKEDDESIQEEDTKNFKLNIVKLWQATNPHARDFRITTIGKAFTFTPVQALPVTNSDNGIMIYRVVVKNPPFGYTAFMMEMEFTIHSQLPPLRLTTSAFITPTSRPCVYPY